MARSATRAAFALLIACCWSVGCTESDAPPERAPRAAEELMPVPAPQFDAEYLADQSQAKLAVAREAPSYEPLETFRQARIEREKPKVRTPAAVPTMTQGGAPPAGAGEGNFWKRLGLKALMGGAPPVQPMEPAEPEGDASQEESDVPQSGDDEDEDSESAAEADESDPEESDADREADAAEDDEASDDEEPVDEGDDEDAAEGSDEDNDAQDDDAAEDE